MKKTILLFSLFLFISLNLNAEPKTITLDNQRTDDNFKLGVVLGYPSGLTAGWHLSDSFELNVVAGTHYSDITVGVAPLFTLVNINISDQIFPLSAGPAAYINIGWKGDIQVDILGNVRWEYSFEEIPLNLFIEGGLGVALNIGDEKNPISPQGSGSLGIRYIF